MVSMLSCATQLGEVLLSRQQTLACAESCTGGMLGQFITSVPGSSQWFDRGFITYSNAAKQEMLAVSSELLEQYGAVSESVAMAMAAGTLQFSAANYSMAVTGIAGPTGGTPHKPVGMICFAFAQRDNEVITSTQNFIGDRHFVREQSVLFALQQMKRLVSQ